MFLKRTRLFNTYTTVEIHLLQKYIAAVVWEVARKDMARHITKNCKKTLWQANTNT